MMNFVRICVKLFVLSGDFRLEIPKFVLLSLLLSVNLIRVLSREKEKN